MKQTDFNGNFEYFILNEQVNIGVPVKFELSQDFPNPFNPTTKISYALPISANVTLIVYDVTGKELASVINSFQPAGYYSFELNSSVASGLASEAYFYNFLRNPM